MRNAVYSAFTMQLKQLPSPIWGFMPYSIAGRRARESRLVKMGNFCAARAVGCSAMLFPEKISLCLLEKAPSVMCAILPRVGMSRKTSSR